MTEQMTEGVSSWLRKMRDRELGLFSIPSLSAGYSGVWLPLTNFPHNSHVQHGLPELPVGTFDGEVVRLVTQCILASLSFSIFGSDFLTFSVIGLQLQGSKAT